METLKIIIKGEYFVYVPAQNAIYMALEQWSAPGF